MFSSGAFNRALPDVPEEEHIEVDRPSVASPPDKGKGRASSNVRVVLGNLLTGRDVKKITPSELAKQLRWGRFPEDEKTYPPTLSLGNGRGQLDLTPVHKEHRGRDVPAFNITRGGDCLRKRRPVVLWAPSRPHDGGKAQTWGSLSDPKGKTTVQMHWKLDSLQPTVWFRIKKPDSETIAERADEMEAAGSPSTQGQPQQAPQDEYWHITFFAKDFSTDDGDGLQMSLQNEIDVAQSMPSSFEPDLREQAASNELTLVKFHFKKPVEKSGRVWNGMTMKELKDARARAADRRYANPQEKLFDILDQDEVIWVWFEMGPKKPTPEDMNTISAFRTFALGVINLNATHGDMWYYRNAEPQGRSLTDPKYDFASVPPPRYTVTNYQYEGSLENPDLELRPVSWLGVRVLEEFSSPEVAAFVHLLGISRERQYHFQEYQRLQDGFYTRKMKARVTVHPSEPTNIFVAFQQSLDERHMFPIPPDDTEVKVVFDERQAGQLAFHGTTVANHFNQAGSFFAACLGPKAKWNPSHLEYVTVYIKDDNKSYLRQIHGIREIHEGNGRRVGVDLLAYVLGAPRTIMEPDAFARSFSKDQLETYWKEIERWDFNETQKLVAKSVIFSPTGTTDVQGPPGTGKTTCTQGIVSAIALASHNVLVTAFSNAAVSEAIQKFAERTFVSDLEFVWFSGAYSQLSKADAYIAKSGSVERPSPAEMDSLSQGLGSMDVANSSRSASQTRVKLTQMPKPAESQLQPADLLWELLSSDTKVGTSSNKDAAANAFHVKLARWISTVAEDLSVPSADKLKKLAKGYLGGRSKLQKANDMMPIDRHNLRAQVLDFEHQLHEYYLRQVVKVVFCTCSTSAHQVLREFFSPTLVVIEEASSASVADIATPLGAHKESVMAVLAAGDPMQPGTLVLNETKNEAMESLRVPLQKKHLEDTLKRWPSFVLDVQYRMDPDIGDYVSAASYKGLLKTHPDNRGRRPDLVATLNEFFKKLLGTKWNGKRLIGLSLDSTMTSERYQMTRSSHNRTVTDLVAALVHAMLSYEPLAEGGCRIKAEDIGVCTHYFGQQSSIREFFHSLSDDPLPPLEGGTTKGRFFLPAEGTSRVARQAQQVPVKSTAQWQSGEADIMIFALCRNEPGEPTMLGFEKDPKLLNVAMSRGRLFTIVIGNFAVWRGNILAGNKFIKYGKDYAAIRGLIDWLFKQKEIFSVGQVISSLFGAAADPKESIAALVEAAEKDARTMIAQDPRFKSNNLRKQKRKFGDVDDPVVAQPHSKKQDHGMAGKGKVMGTDKGKSPAKDKEELHHQEKTQEESAEDKTQDHEMVDAEGRKPSFSKF